MGMEPASLFLLPSVLGKLMGPAKRRDIGRRGAGTLLTPPVAGADLRVALGAPSQLVSTTHRGHLNGSSTFVWLEVARPYMLFDNAPLAPSTKTNIECVNEA